TRRTIFHCLPLTKYKTALDKILCQETQGAFYEFFADEKPFCINGEATGSLFLKNIFRNKKNPAHAKIVNEYFLMQKNLAQEKNASADLSSQSFEMPQSSENEFRIFQAAPCDEEKVFPLERAYQFEEVIPPNFNVSEKLLRDSFRLNLQTQRIFVLQIEGAPVAKAAITACGKNYALLGGVYTLPEFRRKGFATILIRHILRVLAAENKCASLYARKNKIAAVELYKSLGFESVAEYRLIYF
ncbi:MAG: GNAT family N-acetyltransferase, partial [Treponemataceae bacterium]|nr:GNAT family N-acetyltransferase [Treponemataceae bacterium]